MKASNIDIGDLNPLRILRAIWLRPGISRAELARGLGLDKSTITKLVPALLDAGVIADIEKRSSGPNGGRKPISLRINSAYGCVLGLEIQTDCFLATVVDLDGEVLLQLTESFDQAGYGLMEGLQKALSVMKRRMKTLSAPLVGIGLGLPGIVDPHRGMVLECRPFQIAQPFDFFEELRRRGASGPPELPLLDGIPVMIDNDARCCCWSVLSHRRGQSPRNFMFLFGELRSFDSTDTSRRDLSVGFGIVLEGRIYYGDHSASGEFISAFRGAPRDNQFSVTDGEARLIETDPRVRRKVLRELAQNAGLLLNVMDVSMMFVGGSILTYAAELIPLIEEEARRRSTWPTPRSFTVQPTVHGDHAVAYGAAGMVLERFFAVPDVAGVVSRVQPPIPGLLEIRGLRSSGP